MVFLTGLVRNMPVYINGLMLGLSLIMALGPQNIFLIRQGVLRKHALLTAVTCFFCDVILVTASVAGLHRVLELYPTLQLWMTWFGAAFLFYYGINALRQAYKPVKQVQIINSLQPTKNRSQIIMLALGFSLLNPHAIIDSLVLIGGGSSQFPGHHQAFLLGVITSSLIWFSILTLTTYCFSALLSRQAVWKRIELFSGILMIYLSAKLIFNSLN